VTEKEGTQKKGGTKLAYRKGSTNNRPNVWEIDLQSLRLKLVCSERSETLPKPGEKRARRAACCYSPVVSERGIDGTGVPEYCKKVHVRPVEKSLEKGRGVEGDLGYQTT